MFWVGGGKETIFMGGWGWVEVSVGEWGGSLVLI